MLSRRGFFAAAAGAIAGVAGVASAAPVVAVDLGAGPDFTAITTMTMEGDAKVYTIASPDWINDNCHPMAYGGTQPARVQEIFESVTRSQFEPNDLTRQQMAADLPVIGADKLPKNTPAQERRHRKLLKECEKAPVPWETEKQYLRRLSLPCPGMLE